MADGDVSQVLALLAQSGGTARTADTWKHDRMTALLLGAGEPQAAMPLARRRIRCMAGAAGTAGRAIEAGWISSNQFASRMAWRRQTRGIAGEWPALLPEVDALLVMRLDERSMAARWYAQTGFSDVLSVRCLYLDMDAPPTLAGGAAAAAGLRYRAQVVTPHAAAGEGWDAKAWQPQMLAVYQDVYGACGGARPRSADFWAGAIAHHYYREHYQFQIIGLWSAGSENETGASREATLMGYAVVGWSGWHSKRPRMDILELATRQWDTAVAGDLIRTTCQLAWSKNVKQVRAVVSVHDPYRGHLTRTGFADRWGYLMQGKWLHAQRFLDGISAALPKELGDFWLQLAAPGELPLIIGRGARSAPVRSITLHADTGTIARLLLNRTDITGALRDGTLVPEGALSDGEVARLSLAFPWTPWVFHMLDYI
jgi:hypothetical protein